MFHVLDWVLDVPWSTVTADRLDPTARQCSTDLHDLDKVKERIVETGVQKLKSRQSTALAPAGSIKGPILRVVGPPGVSRRRSAVNAGRWCKFVRISLGGVKTSEMRAPAHVKRFPFGRIVEALKQAGAMNPCSCWTSSTSSASGSSDAAALLEVLDPAQNHSFRDHYLEVSMDLSRVLFIATANQLGPVHPALLDRMEIISLAGYTADEKLHIATR
jgi:ATP-dependent Lon protease